MVDLAAEAQQHATAVLRHAPGNGLHRTGTTSKIAYRGKASIVTGIRPLRMTCALLDMLLYI